MSSTLRCFGVGVVLFSLASSTSQFSHGASPASCQGMTPVHIRAHPQDPQNSYVSIRTSASTYLPGQLVTVTVRSSRDFMGFLLQARSMEGTRRRADGGSGVRVGSPVLVGSSWTLTPPGTHKLNCLSEGDAITHSDKQLKRNLSFVWRAPDVPTGDIRFYYINLCPVFCSITVVQSYFVYWAGIESALVYDGSGRWRGINPTFRGVASTVFTMQGDEVTVLPGTIGGTQVYKSLKTLTEVTRPAMEMSSSVTSASLRVDSPINQVLGGRNTSTALGSLQSAPSESLPGVTEGFDPDTQPEKSRNFGGLDAAATVPTNTTFQSSTSPVSFMDYLATTIPLKDVETESKDPNLPTETTTSAVPSTNANTQRSSSENPRRPTQKQQSSTQTHSGPTEPQRNPIKAQTDSWSQNPHPQSSSPKPLWFQTSTSRPVLQHQTVTSPTPLFPQTSSSKLHSQSETSSIPVLSSESPTLQSFLQSNKTSSLPQAKLVYLQSVHQHHNTPSGSTRQPQSTSSFHQEITTQTQVSFIQTDQPQSEIPPEASSISPQTWSLTGQKLTPSSETSQPLNTRVFNLEDLKSRPEITTMRPVFASVPSAIPSFLSESSSLNSSSSTSFSSSVVHLSSTSPPHPSGSVVSMPPSIKSTLSIHSSSSFMKNQPKTAPALSTLPSPSPISSPPHSPSAQPSSSTKPYVTSINYSSPVPLSSSPSFSTPLPSSVTNSALASSSTIPSTPSPFNFTSPSTSPPSSTTISSSFVPSLSSSISFVTSPSSSQSTSPHPGPSPAPRRSLYNPFTSSLPPVPSKELTVAHRLLIQNHIASSEPKSSLNPPTPRTVVYPNPKPHPNLKPNLPKADIKPKRPSNPSEPPDKEGKYPDIIPRHSAWELGMLLGCSAGLGMVLVVGVRYVYRQACGKQTAVTLNDREREYSRGERGMIQVQECGDLVRVRKIRENSFVLLTEYDILAPPGD
ncbi:mucin-2-like [Amphiprion ocellaris]|uniref:mucin-2-like n=1 Tax=Amphiprion ocellaris TaxID=80972 RepID=UPI0024112445|nr:mucin-2-like [Amphiprion ocellaris]